MSVLRSFFVIVFATVSGAILGALMGGIHPLGGLMMMPMTLAASLCLLWPAYVWSRRVRGMTRGRRYLVVLASGCLGGFLALVIGFAVLGRLAGNFSSEIARLMPIGMTFGGATAVCWVVAHYLTGTNRRLTESRRNKQRQL